MKQSVGGQLELFGPNDVREVHAAVLEVSCVEESKNNLELIDGQLELFPQKISKQVFCEIIEDLEPEEESLLALAENKQRMKKLIEILKRNDFKLTVEDKGVISYFEDLANSYADNLDLFLLAKKQGYELNIFPKKNPKTKKIIQLKELFLSNPGDKDKLKRFLRLLEENQFKINLHSQDIPKDLIEVIKQNKESRVLSLIATKKGYELEIAA